MTKVNSFFVMISFLFGTAILGVSLVSASTNSNQLNPDPSSTKVFRFQNDVIPGHILYPLVVLRDKTTITMMSPEDRCQKRLTLAQERLGQAKQLISIQELELGLETLLKGQRYIANIIQLCEKDLKDSQFKDNTLELTTTFNQEFNHIKPAYPDTQRAIIDKLIAENESLQIHLGQ